MTLVPAPVLLAEIPEEAFWQNDVSGTSDSESLGAAEVERLVRLQPVRIGCIASPPGTVLYGQLGAPDYKVQYR